MRYSEFNINEKLFGKDYLIYDWKETIAEIHIFVKSQSYIGKCPHCTFESDHFHATYTRTIQTLPFNGKTTYAHVIAYKYDCLNPECLTKVFMENLPFVSSSQLRTTELNALILAVSIFLSNEGASKVLSLIGIKISNDTIKRIYDGIAIEDDSDIEGVGIDDVAIRKGQSYATAIYDLKDHHLIALLDGRDAKTLKEWLQNHKKIKLVTRDRASSYAQAINEVLPECIQVADRFHLLQNLVERIREIFKDELPETFFIKDKIVLEAEPKKEQKLIIPMDSDQLNHYDYDNSPPIDEDGNLIHYDNKKHDFDGKQYKEQAQRRKEKQQLIRTIQNRWRELEKKNIQTLAKEFTMSPVTIRKYIQMTEEEILALNQPIPYKKRKTVMDDYLNIIYKMLRDKKEPAVIMSYVIKKGYDGNKKTLESYINLLAKNNFNMRLGRNWAYRLDYPDDVMIIKRKELLKHITTRHSQKDEGMTQNFDLIKSKYETLANLEEIYNEFYELLMGDKPDQLDEFIEKNEDSKVKKFIEGIKKDIAPVKNAISYDESSGFVEGNNNKFKLIKRIVYGRANLVNLFKKSYVAFKVKQEDFNLLNLVK